MRAAVVIHAHSGRAAGHDAGALRARIEDRGITVVSFVLVDTEAALRKNVKRARKSDVPAVIVGGGDGSMATAVDVLAKHDTVLGVLPLGTGNSFARSLGLDDSLDKALDALIAMRVETVDLGRVNGTYFANFATIGLSAEIAASASHKLKRLIGPASYAVGGLLPFARRRPFRAKITWDRKHEKLETAQIIIASGRFFGHQPIADDATLVDHRLAFFTSTGVSHVEIARAYVALGLGLQATLPDAVRFSAKDIRVRAKPKQRISIDGNAFGETPARFRVVPRALRAIVGPDFDAANPT